MHVHTRSSPSLHGLRGEGRLVQEYRVSQCCCGRGSGSCRGLDVPEKGVGPCRDAGARGSTRLHGLERELPWAAVTIPLSSNRGACLLFVPPRCRACPFIGCPDAQDLSPSTQAYLLIRLLLVLLALGHEVRHGCTAPSAGRVVKERSFGERRAPSASRGLAAHEAARSKKEAATSADIASEMRESEGRAKCLQLCGAGVDMDSSLGQKLGKARSSSQPTYLTTCTRTIHV